MAITTQSGIPSEIRAGDSYAFTAATIYDGSDGWRASLFLTAPDRSKREKLVSATTSGKVFTFTASSVWTSKLVPAGAWTYALVVTDNDDGDRLTIDEGILTVIEDAASDTLTKSHARKCVEMLEAKLEGRIVADSESVTYLGVNVNQISSEQLTRLLDRYRAEVAMENERERKRRGLGGRGFTSRIKLRG